MTHTESFTGGVLVSAIGSRIPTNPILSCISHQTVVVMESKSRAVLQRHVASTTPDMSSPCLRVKEDLAGYGYGLNAAQQLMPNA